MRPEVPAQARRRQGISWLVRTGRVGMAWAGKFRAIELQNADFNQAYKLALFFVAQRYFVRGSVMSGIKG